LTFSFVVSVMFASVCCVFVLPCYQSLTDFLVIFVIFAAVLGPGKIIIFSCGAAVCEHARSHIYKVGSLVVLSVPRNTSPTPPYPRQQD